MVRAYGRGDFERCAELFVEAYNGPPWYNQWTRKTAERRLGELTGASRAVGFVNLCDGEIVGAAFGYEKTWWKGDELYIEEFYVSPRFQGQGYGSALFTAVEKYAAERSLSCLTLLTDRRKPAYGFYEKNGMACLEQIGLMYKRI